MANTFIFDDDDQPDMGSPMGGPDDDQPDESESGNRSTFTIIAIVIGGIILISLVCMAIAVVFWLPSQNNARATQAAAQIAQQTEQAAIAQQQTEEAQATPTLPPTPVLTDTPTSTPVVVFATETPVSETTQDPATATVEALQTQLASAQLTVTSQPSPTLGTPPALTQTGFADEVGLPGLFIFAVILFGVILLARRLREVPTR